MRSNFPATLLLAVFFLGNVSGLQPNAILRTKANTASGVHVLSTKIGNPLPAHIQVPFATRLSASVDSDDNAASASTVIDTSAIAKYGVALATQMTLFAAFFAGLDKIVALTGVTVPFALNCILFYACALKSRIFNPLANTRPERETKEIKEGDTTATTPPRIMPSWTPPGFIFPIVWLLLIGPLRAYTSSLIVQASDGVYLSSAIMSLMLHLSIGDVWNTINNVERRYGASVLGVLCVVASAAFAAYSYYGVLPLAGILLSLKLIWLTIASSLIVATWQLNPDAKTGKIDSLLPVVGDTATKLVWFE